MDIEWAAEHLRVSLFANKPVEVNEDDWRAVTDQPEADARKAVPGGRVFSGRFEGGLLNFSGAFQRIDIVFAGQPQTEAGAEPQLPSVGSWLSTRHKLFDFTRAWIESNRFPITRIAFGTVLFHPTADHKSTYEVLRSLLSSVKVDPDRMQELLYRINWPTESEVIRGLPVNRITTWSAIQFWSANLEMGGVSLPAPSARMHAVRLDIDHSTDVDRIDVLSGAELSSIFKELISYASENASKGECE